MAKKSDYLEFLKIVGKSKRLLRTGWVREGIKNPESIAAHSFRVGVLTMTVADELKIDKDKLMKMSLIHSLGEAITEDKVWVRWGVVDLKARKVKEEQEIRGIVGLFNGIEGGEEYIEIFEEMILRSSKEAKLFWQIDKLEMSLQAYEYEEEQNKKLDEFFATADLYIKEPFLREMFDEIMRKREERGKTLTKHESL
ncbi:MAG: HD domain-containing protein [Candidatus Levybacteria bacterium]|nr:HD domain-containing protein [Candidatus Levybacteria bacterium]